MNDQLLLTVGIATLNRPAYLEEAIRSVVDAARRTSEPIELIVSDMGCADASELAYRRAIHDAPANLKAIRLERPLVKTGIENWNQCLRQADGVFYMMIGDDDRLLPNAFDTLLPLLATAPASTVAMLASARDIDAAGLVRRERRNQDAVFKGRAFMERIVLRRLALRWCSFVVRTDVLRQTQPFSFPFPGGGGAADGAAILSAAMKGDIRTISKAVSEFRVHKSNDSRGIDLHYQANQRSVLMQFLDRQVSAPPWALNLTRLWLGTGIYFQIVRWQLSGELTVESRKSLQLLARQYLVQVPFRQMPLWFSLFVGLAASAAVVSTCMLFMRKPSVSRPP